MGDSRVVVPDTQTLQISNGDWVLVKKRLNSGENRRMVKRGSVQMADGWHVDTIEAGLAKLLTFLIDWSLKGLDGHVIPIRGRDEPERTAALDAIDPESYTEILRAIEAHEAAMQAERTAEKNAQGGEMKSAPISPLPSGADGPSSTSVN